MNGTTIKSQCRHTSAVNTTVGLRQTTHSDSAIVYTQHGSNAVIFALN